MNAFLHVYLSGVMKKAIEKEMPVKLNRFSFIKGNLKPDFSLLLFKAPHYKITSPEFIKTEMEKFLRNDFPKYAAGTREFSEKLGIVTHYLSDFFCYPHTQRFTGSLFKHYLYERNLMKYYRTVKDKILRFIDHADYSDVLDYESLCSMIERLHEKYLIEKPSFAMDLTYALNACIPLAVYLVSVCSDTQENRLAA